MSLGLSLILFLQFEVLSIKMETEFGLDKDNLGEYYLSPETEIVPPASMVKR